MSNQDNKDFYNNTVSSANQLKDSDKTSFGGDEGLRVLFIGNSITRHGVLESIGWYSDCGMAASSPDKDYVHQTVKMLEERYGKVQFCIAQRSDWEGDFTTPNTRDYFKEAYDFDADIAIFRLGENVKMTQYEHIEIFANALIDAMKYLTEGRRAKLVVTDTFWRNQYINTSIDKACSVMGIESVKIGDLGDDDSMKATGLFAHGGVAMHPGDKGMKAIADRIVAKIDEIM